MTSLRPQERIASSFRTLVLKPLFSTKLCDKLRVALSLAVLMGLTTLTGCTGLTRAGATNSTNGSTGTLAAPSITMQPAGVTVIAGQTASFSVTATGTGTLTYQWNKNNVAINGANAASYTTPPTASSDNNAK